MIIYLIEDDDLKARRVKQYLGRTYPSARVEHLRSYQSGLKAIERGLPDLLLLDMTMPTFDQGGQTREGRPRSMGGRDIMRKMLRKNLVCPVIVVTQFESFGEGEDNISYQQLKEACAQEFPTLFRGMAQYHATSSAWEAELNEMIGVCTNENSAS